MRILSQTATLFFCTRSRVSCQALALTAALFADPGAVAAQTGQIFCSATENGTPSRGTVEVEQAGRKVAAGSCDGKLDVPAGKSKVTVRLDGTLDNPAKSVEVEVLAGKATPVTVDFETAVLEVRIEAKGQQGTGLVSVSRGSQRIGTLGSGVAARLSAGSYEVLVRLGGQEKRYAVELRPGQRRMVRAQF